MPAIASIDLMIIGGGPSGMAAALIAGRARLRTVVLNTEQARNRVTRAAHGFLTRDGISPVEMLAISKKQLLKYTTVDYRVARAESVEQTDGGFLVRDDQGHGWLAKRVVLATGYRDDLEALDLPGLSEVYGRSAFPCPFCDGFEHAHDRLAVFVYDVPPPVIEHYLAMIGALSSSDRIVFTNGVALPDEVVVDLAKRGIGVEMAKVARLHHRDGQLTGVELLDGRIVERDAAFVGGGYSRPATDFAQRLGVETTANPVGWQVVEAEPSGATSVPGLYVIGDLTTGFSTLVRAAAQGADCASQIVREVAMERWHGAAS